MILNDSLLIRIGETVRDDFRRTRIAKGNNNLEKKHVELKEKSKTPVSDFPRDNDTAFFKIRLPDNIPVEVVSELS